MTDEPPQLIDVNLRARRLLPVVVLLIATAILGLAIISVIGMALGVTPITLFLAIQASLVGIAALVGERVSIAHLRGYIEHLVSTHPQLACGPLAERAFTKSNLLALEKRFALLAQAFVATGRVNTTIRNCPPKHATPIEPLTVPFEPLRLEEADAFFGELQDSVTDQPDADLLEPEALEQLRTENTGETWLSLGPRKGVNWALAGLLVLPAAAGIMFLFAQGNITWPGIFVGLLALFGLLSWGYLSGVLQGRQWFVVPGGLILREARFFRPEWKVHLFDRRRSVLIVHRVDHGRRVVFVADADTDKRLTVSPDESEFILRAWLSPLPPPSLDQLTDLT